MRISTTMHTVRVITWNMGMADRSRRFVKTHDQAWRYLLGLSPDLAFLQETLPPDWVESEGRVVRDPFEKWGSLIFSPKLAIEPFALPENSPLRALPKYLAFAEVPLPDATRAPSAIAGRARSFFARVREAGWYDCVWGKRQDEVRTWFGPGKLQQDDYVFCDPSLRDSVDEVSVAEDAATERHLSDHAPLIVDFDVGPIAIADLLA